jgi:hypothetical protein
MSKELERITEYPVVLVDTVSTYPTEILDEDDDDGTMVDNVEELTKNVVGRKIVAVDRDFKHSYRKYDWARYDSKISGTALILDDGTKVVLVDSGDCCAYTDLEDIILNLDKIEHVITGVGTTEGYTKWHIYADLGDVAELKVGWSCGNPFYYGYGFDIYVFDAEGKMIREDGEDIEPEEEILDAAEQRAIGSEIDE